MEIRVSLVDGLWAVVVVYKAHHYIWQAFAYRQNAENERKKLIKQWF